VCGKKSQPGVRRKQSNESNPNPYFPVFFLFASSLSCKTDDGTGTRSLIAEFPHSTMSRPRRLHVAAFVFCITCISIFEVAGGEYNDDYSNDYSDDSGSLSTKTNKLRPSRRQFRSVTQNTVGSATNLNSSSLSEEALRLTDDTSFSRQLKRQEDEDDRKQRLKEKETRASPSRILYAGIAVLTLFSFRLGGSKAIFQELLPRSANVLAVAWLPVVLLHATWIELLSFATLLVQPSIRNFLVKEFVPETWSTLRKLILGELSRKVWSAVMKSLPKPLFTPGKEYLTSTPEWFQQGWGQASEIIDKFVTGLVRKSVQQSVHDSLGIFYESMTNSMLEMTILYEETSGDNKASPSSEKSFFHYAEKELLETADDSEKDESGDIHTSE
jgi:hypothetical protein